MDFLRQMLLLGGLINILSDLLAIIRPDVFRLLDKRFDPMCNPFIGLFAAGVIAAFGCGISTLLNYSLAYACVLRSQLGSEAKSSKFFK